MVDLVTGVKGARDPGMNQVNGLLRVSVAVGRLLFFSKKIVYSRPSNYGSKNYCVALSGPPLGLNDYSLAPPTRG